MTGRWCRAARALLSWSQTDLSERTGISPQSIRAFEKGGGSRDATARLFRLTFEAAGVVLIAENGGGPGVRLKSGRRADGIRPQELTSENDT